MQLDKWAREGASKIKNVHFIGIGGSGMCGLAEILSVLGYKVSGSDYNSSSTLERLEKSGITCYLGHNEENLAGVDLVVCSGAITEDNLEIKKSKELGIPIIKRAEMLAEIMRFGFGIAIAGSHGKTTTTSMMAAVLTGFGEKDVTFIVGGLVKSSNSNAKLGSGKYVVAEADESDGSFLFLHPVISVVTNIDAEHLSSHMGMRELKDIFIRFLHNLPFDGLAVICIDDPILAEIEADINRPLLKYGFSDKADYRVKDVKQDGMNTDFTVIFPDSDEMAMTIRVPGKHNVLNALACIATASFLNIKKEDISKALGEFGGVSRRQDVLGRFSGRFGQGEEMRNITLIDDYGHHPTEIQATLEAIRGAYKDKRCVMIFQPHRHTRTKNLFADFVRVLSIPDQLLLLDIYSAGESPFPGIDSAALKAKIAATSDRDPIYVKDINGLSEVLPGVLRSGDILITQGAGSIGTIAKNLAENSIYLEQEAKNYG